jgi:hypothetical protein
MPSNIDIQNRALGVHVVDIQNVIFRNSYMLETLQGDTLLEAINERCFFKNIFKVFSKKPHHSFISNNGRCLIAYSIVITMMMLVKEEYMCFHPLFLLGGHFLNLIAIICMHL